MPFIPKSMFRDISRYVVSAKGTLNQYYRSPIVFRTISRHPTTEPKSSSRGQWEDTLGAAWESKRERTVDKSWPTESVPGKKNPENLIGTHILTAIGGTYEKIREIDQAIKVTYEKVEGVHKAIKGTQERVEEIEKAIGGAHRVSDETIGEIRKAISDTQERIEDIGKAVGGAHRVSDETIGEIRKAISDTQERIEDIGKAVGGIYQDNEGIGDIQKEIKYLKDKYGRIDGRLRSMQWQLKALLCVLSVFFGLTGYKIAKAVDIEKDSSVKNETG